MFIIFWNIDSIFLGLGFDPLICHYARLFLLYKSPYLYFYSIFDATKKLLFNTKHSTYPMYVQVCTTIVHPLWCYLFVDVFEMGIIGPPLAQSVSTMLNIVVLSIVLKMFGEPEI
jgi:MATE family multidrug resistance protein